MDRTVYKTYKNPTDNPWDSLSMADKAAMMEVAIRNGITTLPEIREAYNEFAKGGNLYPDGGYVRSTNDHPVAFDSEGNLVDQVTGETGTMRFPEIILTADPDDVARGRAQRWYKDFGTESNDATSVADGRRQNSHMDERGAEGATKAAGWAKDHPALNTIGLGLSTLPLAVAAAPAVVGGGELAATALANPYVDAALTSMGGAHAAQSLANGEANWMTALELAPLGRLARPLYEGVVQPGMRLFNSPLTGNWTKIGNREYRLSPNSLGTNGSPIESRGIASQITAENAASITPEQWTAAQDAAIARGDMAEAQRLRDLHFKVSAPTPYISKGVYLPSGSQPTLSQADYYNGNNDLVTLYHSSVDADNLIKEGFDGVEHGLGRTKGEAKGTIFASANPDYAADYSNLYIQEGLSTPDKVGLMELKVPRGSGAYEGNEVRLRPEHIKEITKSAYEKTPWLRWLKTRKTDNNLFNIKSANVVTYDDSGIRIPLGSRDNFNINDIRYGLLPFLGLGTASALYRSSGNENAYGGNLYPYGGTKKQAFLSSLDQSLKEDNRFDSAEWRQFFTDLANQESGYRSDVTNSIGAKGYFQLMPFNRAKTWKNPTQQFHEMYKLTGNNLNYLNKNLTKEDWKRADALGIDMYGMLAGAHLGGAGNVLKALRGKGNAKDMNGSSVMGYMTRFSQRGKTPTLATPSYVEEAPIPLFTPSNPEVFFGGYKAPEIEAPLPSVELEDTPQYSEEEIARQERRERLNNLSMLMNLTSPQGSSNSMLDALGLLMR